MNISESTPTKAVTIGGHTVNIPQPFAEGHPVTANEAHALNQVLVENTRNNMSKRVEQIMKDGGDLQSAVSEYVKNYEFGTRSVGVTVTDPVEREARKMAGDKVKEAIKAKGLKLKQFSDEKFEELVDQTLAKYPAIAEKAKEIVAARKAAVVDIQI